MTDDKNMDFLDDLFELEKQIVLEPSQKLLSAINADAVSSLALPAPIAPEKTQPFETLRELFNWQVLTGLAACCLFGIMIGYGVPFDGGVSDNIDQLDLSELAFGFGDLIDDDFILEL